MLNSTLIKTVDTRPPGLRRFRPRHPAKLVVGAALLSAIVIFVICAPLVGDHVSGDLNNRLAPPLTPGHVLGTDQLGRDFAARIAWGGQTSLTIGLLVVLVSATVGTTLGVLAGYFGGVFDKIVSRVIDAQLSLPLLVFLLMILAVIGPSRPAIVLALSIAQWPEVARLARALSMVVRKRQFIEAAIVGGASSAVILLRHVLPHVRGAVTVLLLVSMAQAILLESALSYLGVGVQRPSPTWGRLLADGQLLMTTSWWLVVLPGVAIAMLVLGANLIADSVRKTE